MKDENRSERHRQIETAAYQMLEEKGFAGASMLSIARKAKASNETLYRWYGDKIGLFSALVERNAKDVKQSLEGHLEGEVNPMASLTTIAPELLAVLVSPRAIALNRAAAADASGVLGATITSSGRALIAPLIAATLDRAREGGSLKFTDTEDAVSLFLDLLVGDLQIRRAIGQLPPLSPTAIKKRATSAVARFEVLLSP